jgi:hypothetical protein
MRTTSYKIIKDTDGWGYYGLDQIGRSTTELFSGFITTAEMFNHMDETKKKLTETQ